jgi:hypothetical protein
LSDDPNVHVLHTDGSADEGFDAVLCAGFLQADGTVDAVTIYQADGAMSEFGGMGDQLFGRGGATKKGKVGLGEDHGANLQNVE